MKNQWHVCGNCRQVFEPGKAPWKYEDCTHPYTERRVYPHRTLAEAGAVALWLADGYAMVDVQDPYFRPRR